MDEKYYSECKHLIVLSAPSGAGKTTIAKHLLKKYSGKFSFSVSATTRPMRPGEQSGVDYFFLTREEFEARIAHDDLIEYEEIFGNYYGTLRSAVENCLKRGEFLLFDVDVKGALSLREAFPHETLLIFVAAPDMKELEARLRARRTESEEQIKLRMDRAYMEMKQAGEFDVTIINSDLENSFARAEEIIEKYCGLEV